MIAIKKTISLYKKKTYKNTLNIYKVKQFELNKRNYVTFLFRVYF